MKKEHEILFEPFKIGTVMIKNRFVLEPMEGTNMIDCLPILKLVRISMIIMWSVQRIM